MVFSYVIRGRPGGLFQFPGGSGGEPLGSSWRLHYHPYVNVYSAQIWRDAVTRLSL